MPLYGLYSFSFRDQNNINHSVEIWKDSVSALPPATIIRGDANPFTVSMPGLSDKFQPVRGTGCQINLVSQTNMQFIGLYTARMQEYQIRHYINSVLNWCGWLDSELYTEPFDDIDGYTVSFSGSDGFALLDRMNYLQADGSKFTGISSQFDVLKFILEKLNLPILNTYIYLSTAVTGATTTGGQTALDVTYVNNSNYYNEDGEPETLRTVLESILRPYGAFITQSNGSLFITDVQQISTGSLFTMSKYTGIMGAYIDDTGIDADIGDISDIGISDMGQTFNVVPGINKQVVSFSPYNQIDIIDYAAEEDFSTPGTVTSFGTTPYRWTETEHGASVLWNKADAGKFIKLNGVDDTDAVDYYLKINKSFDYLDVITKQFEFKGELPLIIPANYKLRLRASAYFRRSTELEDPDFIPSVVSRGDLYLKLAIGGKKIVNTTGAPTWVDVSTTTAAFFLRFEKAPNPVSAGGMTVYYPIEDQWMNSGFYLRKDQTFTLMDQLIPLDAGFTNGVIALDLYGYICENLLGAPTAVLDARFKDIQLTIVDAEGNDYKDIDLEYVGYLNAQYKESGADLQLLHGSNTDNFPTCRGGLLKYDGTDYSFIQQWTRAGVTDLLENLLLRSYVGNYQGRTREISAKVNRLPRTVGFLTYATYLTGKYMLTAFTHNYEQVSTELTMQEIFSDALTINKSF